MFTRFAIAYHICYEIYRWRNEIILIYFIRIKLQRVLLSLCVQLCRRRYQGTTVFQHYLLLKSHLSDGTSSWQSTWFLQLVFLGVSRSSVYICFSSLKLFCFWTSQEAVLLILYLSCELPFFIRIIPVLFFQISCNPWVKTGWLMPSLEAK